ncbi:antigen [Emericellopsis cladophorae]|uniref:Antigen n=1 Tax=Emericellopsis cladophorae TaxID=2686198 RepID=A0A9P9XTS8_9HYPO|nr:antigen [Emericellopsis cladophorae]KAI6777699.1 antigen [Emericellopsis cladophorae]
MSSTNGTVLVSGPNVIQTQDFYVKAGVLHPFIIGSIAVITLFVYLRLGSNRSIAPFTVFDWVVNVALGSTLAGIVNGNSLVRGLLALATMLTFQYLISMFCTRFERLEWLVQGQPLVLVFRGKMLQSVMHKHRISCGNLNAALRQNGVANICLVECAIVEPNGSISVFTTKELENAGVSPDTLLAVTAYKALCEQLEETLGSGTDGGKNEEEAGRDRDHERRRAESERRRAEAANRDRNREQRRAESERRRADQAEYQSRSTTLIEYIRETHRLLELNVTTESDKSLTSKGTITNPRSKYVPSILSAWRNFLETQSRILGRLYSTFPADRRAFESVGFLQGLGERVAGRPVANEKDLEHTQQNIVEEPVAKIIEILRSDHTTLRQFDLGGGIVFDNHPNGLSDGAEGPSQRRARHKGNQLYADQRTSHYTNTSSSGSSAMIRMQYGLPHRNTDDIDLVVQPTDSITAESISTWLLQSYPTAFVTKSVHGVLVPALRFQRSDGSVKNFEIEIFDVGAWPQRSQYDLSNPANEVVRILISGFEVPVFSARWLLREKIVTALERQGSRKERTDLEDACALVQVVDITSLDLTGHAEAVQHILTKKPDYRQQLELKIICPDVLGRSWTWNESAGVYWRLEGDQLRYMDDEVKRHKFKWEATAGVRYFKVSSGTWYYNGDDGDIAFWG